MLNIDPSGSVSGSTRPTPVPSPGNATDWTAAVPAPIAQPNLARDSYQNTDDTMP